MHLARLLQTVTRVKPYICTMPLRLDEGWNHVQINLGEFCKRAYGTNVSETLRIQVTIVGLLRGKWLRAHMYVHIVSVRPCVCMCVYTHVCIYMCV